MGQRPEGGERKDVLGRSEGPKVELCLADMGTCWEASVGGLLGMAAP